MPDLDSMHKRLQELLAFDVENIDEGCTGGRGPQVGTGDERCFLTWPGKLEVSPPGNTGSGTIRINYDCRKRSKHFVGRVESSTKDTQHPASVTAKYAFTFSGQVMISDIHVEGNKEGLCGNSIESKLNNLNGAFVD